MDVWDKPTVDAPLAASSDAARVRLDLTDELQVERRYSTSSVLGAGGMGEVRLVHDARVGRDIAMKVMAKGKLDSVRFLREARIQGQLEHPAIVPVYDLAAGEDGELYFTMKRVRGKTLEDIIAGRDAHEPGDEIYSRRRLLSAFVSVCLAVDFAHSRGVLHRDLKPSNLMLGHFGEVYVLDWGIAKLAGDAEASQGHAEVHDDTRYATAAGLVLGTAGFMAPEQVRADTVDARADVYALGAILFEILTGAPLNTGQTAVELMKSTLVDAAPRVRAACSEAAVPPELEAVCLRATALDLATRTGSARAVANAIERFLDGDRDLARRKELALEHASSAKRALPDALGGDEQARRHATLDAGRSLALDPDCEEAARVLMSLLTAPPKVVPAEVEQQLAEHHERAARTAGRVGALGFLAMITMTPFLVWMGVRSWPLFALGVASLLVGTALSLASARWPAHARSLFATMLVLMAAFVALLTTLFGPLFVAPSIAMGLAIVAGFHPFAPRRVPVLLMCGGFVVPFALELAGLWAPAYTLGSDAMVVRAGLVSFPFVPTLVYLALSSTLLVVCISAFVNAVRATLDAAQRAVLVQAWQLRQLLPDASRADR